MTPRCRRLAVVITALLLVTTPALAWDDRTGDLDMPWLGGGGRARLFADRATCIMCPTGYTDRRRWGRSGRSGEEPYGTVGAALRFLQQKGVLDAWPEALAEGTVIDDDGIIEPRAAPYRFTVIMIQPTVVIMRFDLGALVKVGEVREGQSVGTPRLNQPVEFGTHVPATGTLLWFSPDAGQPPAPVPLSTPDHGEIVVKGTRLVLQRRGDEWIVDRP
jgi:hypothetical protein